jgi:hypothetical protein
LLIRVQLLAYCPVFYWAGIMVKKHCIRVTPPRIIAELAILFHTSSTTMYILELPPCHPRQKWKERWHKVKVGIWRSRSLSFLNIDRDSVRILKARETAGDGVVNYETGIVAAMQYLDTHAQFWPTGKHLGISNRCRLPPRVVHH